MRPEEQLTAAQSYQLHGPFYGIVESTTDPFMIGRIRVRVLLVYGEESQTPTNMLPWAAPCFPAFWFSPPQVGDAVWVMFEGGDPRSPVYLGWMPTNPAEAQQRQRHPGKAALKYDGTINDGDPYDRTTVRDPLTQNTPEAGEEVAGSNTETYVTPAHVPEAPPEVRKGRSFDPNTRVFKTFRGHTIVFNDHPESEYVKIIDRSGQMIVFDCAVKFDANKNNATPRGGSIDNCFVEGIGEADSKVHNGRTQLPIDKMRVRPEENERASIRMTDLFGQYLEYWAERDKARIRFQSARFKDDDQTPNHYIEISSQVNPADEHIEAVTREGHQLRLDETQNAAWLMHKEGSIVIIDENANITITTVI